MWRPKLVVCDNEGCFIAAKGEPIAINAVSPLRRFLDSNADLKFTFCTGRSVPYMEAMVQLAGLTSSKVPVVCEGGCVLYHPSIDRWTTLSPRADHECILSRVDSSAFRLEPGKMVCLTLYPEPPLSVAELADLVRVSSQLDGFEVGISAAAVDITPKGVDKGSGLRALAECVGIELDEVLCIGDSNNDLAMLSIAGRSACPANATPEVKATVDYVSDQPHALGVLDILRRYDCGAC